jgi:hypothetical protein
LLQFDISQIIVHEADEPNAVVDRPRPIFSSKRSTSLHHRRRWGAKVILLSDNGLGIVCISKMLEMATATDEIAGQQKTDDRRRQIVNSRISKIGLAGRTAGRRPGTFRCVLRGTIVALIPALCTVARRFHLSVGNVRRQHLLQMSSGQACCKASHLIPHSIYTL